MATIKVNVAKIEINLPREASYISSTNSYASLQFKVTQNVAADTQFVKKDGN